MKTIVALAASALALTILLPSDAEAQRRGVRAGGGYRAVGARGVVVAGPRYGSAYYRRGFAPGVGIAAGALAVGAVGAAVTAPYYGYGSADPCLRQQQVWNGYGYQWQWVRVC